MYGKRYVWIIIGWYEDKWWERSLDKDNINCSPAEMGQAVEGYLATDHMKLNEDDVTSKKKTVSGWVRNMLMLFLNKIVKKEKIKRKQQISRCSGICLL